MVTPLLHYSLDFQRQSYLSVTAAMRDLRRGPEDQDFRVKPKRTGVKFKAKRRAEKRANKEP